MSEPTNCFNMSIRATDDEVGFSLDCDGKNDSIFFKTLEGFPPECLELIKNKVSKAVAEFNTILDKKIKK